LQQVQKEGKRMGSKKVVLIGALDTKGLEYQFVRDLLVQRGLETIIVDFGVMGDPSFEPDISASEVSQAGGSSLEELRSSQDKSQGNEDHAKRPRQGRE
jgi:uncharacterized protein (UPF0261 family)